MRWLMRSALLCLIITVVTPAPAQAWFAWLDRLSGPGPWWGPKVDVRALCFGAEIPPEVDPTRVDRAALRTHIEQLRRIDQGLRILTPSQRDAMDRLLSTAGDAIEPSKDNPAEIARTYNADRQQIINRSAFIASPGIFISLCPSDRIVRSIALELGFTAQGTPGTETYANNQTIWLTTFTAGFSYRIPLPVSRDFIDVGTNAGAYRFYSKGFEDFSGFTIEPFVDLHLPTRLQVEGSKWERFFGRFTVRAGLQFFPGGFQAEQFAAIPGTPDITGKEANPSVTLFFRLKPS